jgi:hypothetical protein
MYNEENVTTKLKKMSSLAPDVITPFRIFDKAAVSDGSIPVKFKELIAVAIAFTTQCRGDRCRNERSSEDRRRLGGGSGGHTCDACLAELKGTQTILTRCELNGRRSLTGIQ